jgi:hypothetical protein
MKFRDIPPHDPVIAVWHDDKLDMLEKRVSRFIKSDIHKKPPGHIVEKINILKLKGRIA